MKEFNHNIVIEFDYQGRRIRQKIDAKDIKQHRKGRFWTNWTYSFTRDGVKFTVFGSIDKDGDFRTSGPVDAKGHCSVFFVMTEMDTIDDIDIVAVDAHISRRSVYVTVRLDYECDDGMDGNESAQEVVSQADYEFRSPFCSPVIITGSEICEINQ